MAKISLATLKTKFETGDKPAQQDFYDLIDTLEDATSVASLESIVALKAAADNVYTKTEIDTNMNTKLSKSGDSMSGPLDFNNQSISQYNDKFFNGGTTSGLTQINYSNGPLQKYTLGGNHTLSLPTANDGASLTLIIVGGNNYTPSFSNVTNWIGTTSKVTAPTFATVSGNINVLTFFAESGVWYGFLSGTGV